MPTSTTPNMGLVLPSPSLEPGPLWATELNAAFVAVDTHDHSTGKGIKVSQTGILFTADFSANNFRIIDLMEITLVPQSGTLNIKTSLYANTAGDLIYVDQNGNQIQMTGNGALLSKGIGGQYTTDPSFPSVFYTTALLAYTFTINGTILASVKFAGYSVGVTSSNLSAFTIATSDPYAVWLIDTSTFSVAIALPFAASAGIGRMITIKDRNGGAATRNISITRQGSDTIDGSAAANVISTNKGVSRFVSDGVSNWAVI